MRHVAARRIQKTRTPERGFALLVIFLIAAAVAFTMYQELPRAAFESARDREQLLMDRGNQYKRAIQVYFAENKRYPAEIKDLESTNNKRYLRRRYIDPMTGKDEWRLVHTNGSFLTDSLVTKPPTQNANGGLPGQGQTPGGGPLGANNMNTAAATGAANSSSDPAVAGAGLAALNPMAQRRPSDRGAPTGPGYPEPGSAPGGPAVGSAYSFGANSAGYDPSDPRTWPPITVATPSAQPGQPQQQGQGAPSPRGNFPFGGGQSGGLGQPAPGQFGAVQSPIQGNLGQFGGQGGANPQPPTMFNPNPQPGDGLIAAPAQNVDGQNAPQFPVNSIVQNSPYGNQPPPSQPELPPQVSRGQATAIQTANLAAGGFNPQVPPQPQYPGGTGTQPNPALPGNNTGNAALNAIDNALFRPNQAPALGAVGSPGIAGVATTFKGPSIKAYRERTKYQEWEFVYEPNANQPAANQPGNNQPGLNQPGLNQAGMNQPGTNQAGGAGQNPFQMPNGNAPGSGQLGGGAAPSNPFSTPNPFAPSSGPTH